MVQKFIDLGFEICATEGTHNTLLANGIPSTKVLKISEGRPNIKDLMANGEIAMAINTSDNKSSKEDTKLIRIQVLKNLISYFTTLAGAEVAAKALQEMREQDVNEAVALQDYLLCNG